MPCPCANITTVGAVISAMPYLYTALPKGKVVGSHKSAQRRVSRAISDRPNLLTFFVDRCWSDWARGGEPGAVRAK